MMKEKKKILFLIPTLMNGGAERVLINLVNNLNFDLFEVSVKTVMDVGRYKDSLDKRVHYSYIFPKLLRGTSYFFMLFSPAYLFNKYIGYQYDIVVSYLEGMTSRIVSGCQNPKIKIVSWIHIELLDRKAFKKDFRSFSEAIKCYGKFNKIACVSRNVKECFDNLSGLQEKTEVLYNTNDTRDINRRKSEEVTDVEFSRNTINICSVAKIVWSKGYDRLARIHKLLMDGGIKNHIYIIGIGPEQEKLESYLRDNKLTDSFTFLGYKENPYKYLSKCDLYVCSSRREGFSTAVTEALVIGLPVVSTRCSGAEELLGRNNEYGLVTDNDEESLYIGIKEMLTNDGWINKYKQLSAERGNKFSTELTVEAVTEMFLKI